MDEWNCTDPVVATPAATIQTATSSMELGVKTLKSLADATLVFYIAAGLVILILAVQTGFNFLDN